LFLLLGDHAGNAVPAALGTLGLSREELGRHIALDIGISELGAALSERLDAPFIEQRYSRLVVDCNRARGAVDAIPAISDGIAIAGNGAVSDRAARARYAAIFDPYHGAIGDLLAGRDAAGMPTIVVSLHSFTPVMAGFARPWTIGVLHDGGDTRFALATLGALRERAGQGAGGPIGDNVPYRMDGTDHTVPRHAYPRRRPYAEIEVRQDLLSSPGRISVVADLLAEVLECARRRIGDEPAEGRI